MMPYWEYCEVGWTPQQITIHVYSVRADGSYEGVQEPEEWGRLLAQLGADGWEMVGIVPTEPASHTLYYFKRPIDSPQDVAKEKQEKLKAEQERQRLLEEFGKGPPGTPLRLHNAIIFKSTSPESAKQPTDEESKTVMNVEQNPDQVSNADSSSIRLQDEP